MMTSFNRMYGWYVKRVRRKLEHSLFGKLEITYCIPEIRMYWWRSCSSFPPLDYPVMIELHCPPTGPNLQQEQAYRKLLIEYSTLLDHGARNGDIPTDTDRIQLEQITLFVHGHIDLLFRDDQHEYTIHADQNATYMTPEVAAVT